MSKFKLKKKSLYPIVTQDTDEALTNDQVMSLFTDKDDIMLCVRSGSGARNRGGYYFCIHRTGNNSFQLETIEKDSVDCFNLDNLVDFINHASGRKFNSDLLDYCQNHINFRND